MEIPLAMDITPVSIKPGDVHICMLTSTDVDFLNGWDKGVLQNAVDKCHCDKFGDVSFVLPILI
jgi:hypothetical protein